MPFLLNRIWEMLSSCSLDKWGRLRDLVGSTLDHYHLSSNLGVGISEGCFVFEIVLLNFEVVRAIKPTMCTKRAVKHKSSSSSSSIVSATWNTFPSHIRWTIISGHIKTHVRTHLFWSDYRELNVFFQYVLELVFKIFFPSNNCYFQPL